ncbi:MAG: hypothetical protein RBR06_00730 [Desulfuromonadaceae bacterium]|nr:hypothetical protein [Desulfuromonadaceae bacterium]
MRNTFYIALIVISIFFLAACTKPGEQAYNQGVKSLNEGKTEQARTSFLRAIEENPRLAEAYLNLGRIDIKLADFVSARGNTLKALNLLQEYKKTIRSGSTWTQQAALACNNMASIAFQQALLIKSSNVKDSNEASISSIQTETSQDRSSGEDLEAAETLINEAEKWLDQALELDPSNETVLKNRRFIQKWRE